MSDFPPVSNLTSGPGDETTAPIRAPRERHLPEQIGPYRVVDEIGAGGMGLVYRARRDDLKQDVAVKLIKLGMDTEEVLTRFESERQALALLNHPNVARVYDAGATETGRPYFVMEYVAGVPITSYCDSARMTTKGRLELFNQACQAVQHAHQKGIIHRDLKPSNMLVTLRDGLPLVKVIDFGLAKATTQRLADRTLYTERGQLLGTPEYMSPEQADLSALDVDTRTDVYSLGVVLYELLTGARPFESKALRSVMHDEMRRIIREVDPPTPSAKLTTLREPEELTKITRDRGTADVRALRRLLTGELDAIAMKAIEKDRARRYPTAAELEADVVRYLRNEPVTAAAPTVAYRTRKFLRRHRRGVAVAAILVLALIAGTITTAYQAIRAKRNLALALAQQSRAETAEAQAKQRLELVEKRLNDTRKLMNDLDALYQRMRLVPGTIPARQMLATFTAQFLDALYQEGPDGLDERLLNDVGIAYQRLGDMQGGVYVSGNIGDIEGASASYRKSTDLLTRAMEKNKSPVVARHLSVSYERCGEYESQVGRYDEALKSYSAAARLRADLVAADKANLLDVRNQAVIFQKLGGVKSRLGKLDEALADCTEAVRGFRDLLKRDSKEPRRRIELAAALYSLAQVRDARDEREDAATTYADALHFAEEHDKALELKDFESQRLLAISSAMTGAYDLGSGRIDLGLQRCDRAAEIVRQAVRSEPENFEAKLAQLRLLSYVATRWEWVATNVVALSDAERNPVWGRCDRAYGELLALVESIDAVKPMPDKQRVIDGFNEARARCRAKSIQQSATQPSP